MAIVVHFKVFLDILPLDDHKSATIVAVNEIHAAWQEMFHLLWEQKQPKQLRFNPENLFPKSEIYPSSNGPNRNQATLEWWHLHVLDPHQVGSKREARQLPRQSM